MAPHSPKKIEKSDNISCVLNVLRVALYPRVSTEEQFLKGYSLQTQEEVLTQYALAHGFKIKRYTEMKVTAPENPP